MRDGLAGTVEGWHSLRNRSRGSYRPSTNCRDRATAPIEDIRWEKIRGCSDRGNGARYSMSIMPGTP